MSDNPQISRILRDIFNILWRENRNAVKMVYHAYEIAEKAHSGAKRDSGEPYIIHPLSVAKNLLNMEIYDADTICAAILHDTVEDTDITLEDIEREISKTTSELVDGVTKMKSMESTEEARDFANTRKIVNGLTKDIRIILIKLADRLHNMKTLQYKKKEKQIENARETMDIFVPLAASIGAYQIKSELEDLALSYLEHDWYQEIYGKREDLGKIKREYLTELSGKLNRLLRQKGIPSVLLVRVKTIANIYKEIKDGYEMDKMSDLFYLKVLVDEVDECYRTLGIIHSNLRPIQGTVRDYIGNPRTNLYRALHTTCSDPECGEIVKAKIETYDMASVAANGIAAHWNIDPNKRAGEIPRHKTIEETQDEIRRTLQFARNLQSLDNSAISDSAFIAMIKKDLLTEQIYPSGQDGKPIELPKGATALDFICDAYWNSIDSVAAVTIDGKRMPMNTPLKTGNIVQVITGEEINRANWEEFVTTERAKQKIKLFLHRQSTPTAL